MKMSLSQLQTECSRLRTALERIDDMRVTEIGPESGDIGMSPETKSFCAAFGACIVIAHEALDPEYYGVGTRAVKS